MWLGPHSALLSSLIVMTDIRAGVNTISVITKKLKLISPSFMTMCGASSPLAQQFSLFKPFVFVARFTFSFSGFGKLVPRVAYFIYEHLSKLAVI